MAYLADQSARGALVMRAGRGVALGDVGGSGLRALLEQVNRFTGPGGPAAHKFAPQPFDVAAGNLSSAAALTAILIFQARLIVAQTGIQDVGTSQLLDQTNAAIKAGSSAVIAWVAANSGRVTQSIGGYADALGLPGKAVAGNAIPSSFVTSSKGFLSGGVSPVMIAAAAVGVFALFQYMKVRK
jgi:hypothetical protein